MSLPPIFVINPPSITDNRPPSINHWHKKLFYKHTFKVLHFIYFDESGSFAKAKKKFYMEQLSLPIDLRWFPGLITLY